MPDPKIARGDLTKDEEAFVTAALADELYPGPEIMWKETSFTHEYEEATLTPEGAVAMKPGEVVEGVQQPPIAVTEKKSESFPWRVYESGGAEIRAFVFEDICLGRYGELPRRRVRASGLLVKEVIDLSYCEGLPSIELSGSDFLGMNLNHATLGKLELEDCCIGDAGFLGNEAEFDGELSIELSYVKGEFELNGAQGQSIFGLAGSKCRGAIRAQGGQWNGGVFLHDGFEAWGQVGVNSSTIGGQLNVEGAKLRYAGENCLQAFNLKVTGAVFLDDGFEAWGPVVINSSTIGGQLSMRGAKLRYAGEYCLRAFNLKVTEDVFLNDGFEAWGPVVIHSSTIEGGLEMKGAKLRYAGENCLQAQGLKVTGSVFLNDGFEAWGEVDINSSTIGGHLGMRGTKLRYAGENCLRAFNLNVTGSVFLDVEFEAWGPVEINSSTIGGQLAMSGAKLRFTGENCLRADGLKVAGDVFLDVEFEAWGPVEINSSTIGGQLAMSGAKLRYAGENCLQAQGLKVTGSVFLNDGFEAWGEVDINSSTIGGHLGMRGTKLRYAGENCLRAFNLKVTGDVFLYDGFEAWGPVDINSSTIGGHLLLSGVVRNLKLYHATIEREFSVLRPSNPSTVVQVIDLTNAEIGVLNDGAALVTAMRSDSRRCWLSDVFNRVSPQTYNPNRQYMLDGATFGRLGDEFLVGSTEKERMANVLAIGSWLENADDGKFLPGVYEHFATLLQAQGRPEDARQLLIRKSRHGYKSVPGTETWAKRWKRRFAAVLLDLPIAHGYRPMQVLWVILATWILASLVVWNGWSQKMYAPVGANRAAAIDLLMRSKAVPEVKQNVEIVSDSVFLGTLRGTLTVPGSVQAEKPLPTQWRDATGPGFVAFSPVMYALDHIIPIMSFGQKAAWDVDREKPLSDVFLVCQYFAIFGGWVLATLFAGAFTGVIKNRN